MGRPKKNVAQTNVQPTIVKSIDHSIYIITIYALLSVIFIFEQSPIILTNLIPWILLLTSIFVIYKLNPNRFFLSIIVIIMALTFLLQAIAVLTGIPFGSFFYLNSLGIRFLDVPIVIVINWTMIILSSYVFSQRLLESIKTDQKLTLLLTPIIVTLIDYILEPVAISLRFWNWREGLIPSSNYISWFIFAFICTLFIYFITWGKRINNSKYLLAFLIGQIVFFTIINILIIS